MYLARRRSQHRTPCEIVPSMPARAAYRAANSGVPCRRRVACNASYSSRRRIRSTRSRRAGPAGGQAEADEGDGVPVRVGGLLPGHAPLALRAGRLPRLPIDDEIGGREALVGPRLPTALRPGGADEVAVMDRPAAHH